MSLLDVFTFTALICYLSATIAIITRLFDPQGPNIKLVLTSAAVAIACHLISSTLMLFAQESINFSLPNVVSVVSLLLSIVITCIALRNKVNLLLPVVYGFAALWMFITFFMADNEQYPIIHSNFAVVSHITLSLIGYCVLVISTLFAFQVSYIDLKLKSKNLKAVNHFPPLMQVEGQLFALLTTGTALLFLAQLSGFIFLEGFIGKENAHKTVLSLLSLLIYSIILFGRYKQGWRGHKVLILTTTATFILTLAYFGSRFVREYIIL